MMYITTVISTRLDSIKRRLVKVLRFGKSDVQEVVEVGSHGIDSNPVKGMKAIYAATNKKGQNVIIGYMLPDKLAEIGEVRVFSTDENGEEQIYVWLKNNGTIEMAGNVDNLVRYFKLNQGLQQEVLAINAELAKIATAITSLGGAYVVDPVSLDISDSKIDEIKTL